MSTDPSELEGPDPTLSSDARDSTYAEAEAPDTNPPSGPRVEQTLGKPGSGSSETKTKTTRSSGSTSSSSSSSS